MAKDGIMPVEARKKTYTEKTMIKVVKDLIVWSQCMKSEHDYPEHFMKKHPWTRKYLTYYGEAHNFKRLVDDPDMICEVEKNELMTKWRIENSKPRQVRIRVSLKDIRNRRGGAYTQIFTFEEISDGLFRCNNG